MPLGIGIGGAVSGVMRGVGSIFGGLKASQIMNEATNTVRKDLNEQLRDNQDWYDRRYNEDATQRADAQRMLAMTMDAIRDRSMDAKGTQAVMGGTEESMAATRAANANTLADSAAQIAIAGANRKDDVENKFLANKSTLRNKLNELTMSTAENKASNIKEAVNGVTSAAGDIAKLFG